MTISELVTRAHDNAVIRIADLCGHLGIDLEAAIDLKMAYNETRPSKHGKRF